MKIYILVLLLASSAVCFAGSAEGKSSIGKEEFDQGFMYYSTAAEPEYGKIDRETIELAIKWFRKSAELGHAEAQYYLGVIYATGYGVTKNDNEAVKWLRKSAEQENANAQNFIGSLYENGRGIAKDEKLAVILYRLAAEQGNANAQNNLATMYEQGRGIAKDEKQAVILYRRAAEQGNVNAQKNLGIMYEQGRGIAKDDEQAVIFYRLAAEQGNANAQNNLGIMYEQGRGIAKDDEQAVILYRRAAEQGNANAQKNLGTMYEKGKGIRSNWVIAQMLYGLAANNDDEVAVEYQVELSKRLTSAQISEAHALGANWKVNMPLPSSAKSDPSSEAKNKIIAAEIQQQKAAKAQQVNAEIQRRKNIPYTAIQPPVNLNSKDDVGMCHALMFVMFEVSQTEEGRLRLSSLPSEEKKQAEILFMRIIGGALRMQSRMDVLLKSASTGQYFEPKHNKYRDRLGVLSEEQRSSFIGKNMPRCLDAGQRAPKSDFEILAEKQKK